MPGTVERAQLERVEARGDPAGDRAVRLEPVDRRQAVLGHGGRARVGERDRRDVARPQRVGQALEILAVVQIAVNENPLGVAARPAR